MARLLFRLLGEAKLAATAASSQEAVATVDSDFVVIIAVLLCALICVLGLIAVTRCAWIRRISGGNDGSAASQSPPPPPALVNKGLKKKAIRSLPKLTYSADSPVAAKFAECAICLAEFTVGDELRVLPQCGHGFHLSCIDAWLGSHSSCPSCRQILIVARCQKCGGFPGSSRSGSEPETRFKETLDVPNNFLP